MGILLGLGIITLSIAYTNGSNSNFKGVATLYGGGLSNYRSTLYIGTAATFMGSLCSLALAAGLMKAFSGEGIVSPSVAGSAKFLFAVAVGTAGTVFIATRLGLPVSTTHGLLGGLVGAGLIDAGWNLQLRVLGRSLLTPLLLSPILATLLAAVLYPCLRGIFQYLSVDVPAQAANNRARAILGACPSNRL